MAKQFFLRHKVWLWPLLGLLLITPFTPQIDLAIERYFFENNHFSTAPVLTFIFDYGVIPAQLTFGLAVCLFMASFFPKWKAWRKPALALVLTLAIGAGLITHVILKDHWGRPRPRQVIAFGGQQPFRPYYSPNFFHQPEPSKSFPCGHCTMGFYFLALALIGRRFQQPVLFWIGLSLALSLGALLSWARMAQGGHFFSDTLVSALIMWLTSYAFVYGFGLKINRQSTPSASDLVKK